MTSEQAPGRGTPLQPANRFERIAVELAPEWLEEQQRLRDAGEDADPLIPRTEYYRDSSRSDDSCSSARGASAAARSSTAIGSLGTLS